LAAGYLNRISGIADYFDFGDKDRWLGDFAIGFVDGHIFHAQLLANEDPTLRWSYGTYPWESEGRSLFVALVSDVFQLPEGRTAEAFDRAAADRQNSDSEFIAGALAANRILLKLEFDGATGNDRHTRRIEELWHSYKMLPGQSWLRLFLAPSNSPELYAYLVVKTLGKDAFGVQLSDETLAEMLGIGKANMH
jgi:hypothetical protein